MLIRYPERLLRVNAQQEVTGRAALETMLREQLVGGSAGASVVDGPRLPNSMMMGDDSVSRYSKCSSED